MLGSQRLDTGLLSTVIGDHFVSQAYRLGYVIRPTQPHTLSGMGNEYRP